MHYKLSVLMFLIMAPSSFALIGHGIFKTKESDHPTVCRLDIKFNDHETGHCTGTLVGEKTIYTAAHCFRRGYNHTDNPVNITCGGKGMGSAAQVEIPEYDLWIDANKPNLDQDFAVVTALFKTKTPPNPVATGPELYFGADGKLLPGVKCTMLGFGQTDISGRITSGTLIQTNLEEVNVTYTPAKLLDIFPLEGEVALRTTVGEGDSGGPLFCEAPGHESELLGVIDETWNAPDGQIIRNILNSIWAHVGAE